MGRTAGAGHAHRSRPRAATLAKKALSIRPRQVTGADARPRPGALGGGRQGASRSGQTGAIDWLSTLLRGRPKRASELLRKPRSQRPGELWLLVVDASASTRRHGALSQAKGLLATVLQQAYQQRARVAVVQATGLHTQWPFQGQKSSPAMHSWLSELGAGGGTPLIEGLAQTHEWLVQRQRRRPGEQQRVLVLTDGRLRDWPTRAPLPCPALLVDIESGPIRLGRARQLAEQLGADYRLIEDLVRGAHPTV
ncbi:MAG: VWA domain-containing protein [Pseudomonas sp.]